MGQKLERIVFNFWWDRFNFISENLKNVLIHANLCSDKDTCNLQSLISRIIEQVSQIGIRYRWYFTKFSVLSSKFSQFSKNSKNQTLKYNGISGYNDFTSVPLQKTSFSVPIFYF